MQNKHTIILGDRITSYLYTIVLTKGNVIAFRSNFEVLIFLPKGIIAMAER